MKTIRTAQRSDWKADSMNSHAIHVPMEMKLTAKEMKALRIGFIPDKIGDRWFAYMENNTLYLHHSWTGFCAYAVEFAPCEEGYEVASLLVAPTDPYSGNNMALRAEVVEVLIKHCIVRNNLPLLEFQESNETLWEISGIAV